MKRTIYEKIIIGLYYLSLVSGVIILFIMFMLRDNEAVAGGIVVTWIILCSNARDILNKERDRKFWERHERICKTCVKTQ